MSQTTFSPDVRVEGLEALERAAKVLPNRTGKALAQAQRTVAPVVQKMARANAGRVKGQLSASILIDGPRGTRLNTFTRIYTNLKHAIFQEQGTGIYAGRGLIRPKNGRFMAWKKDGKWIFARKVRGVRPKRFMERAAKDNSHRYWSHVNAQMKEVLAKLPR